MRLFTRIFSSLLAIICCFIFCCPAFATDYPVENAVVLKEARVRKETSSKSAKVATLKKNTVLTVTGESEDKNGELWYMVETKDGKTGYVRSDFIELPKAENTFSGPSITMEMTVKVTAKCKTRNHVGSAWSKKCYIDDVELPEEGSEIETEVSVTSGVPMKITSKLTEHDKNPDIGKSTMEYIPTNTDLDEGFEITQEVRVKENTGKYKGYAAVWNVTYTFAPITGGRGD